MEKESEQGREEGGGGQRWDGNTGSKKKKHAFSWSKDTKTLSLWRHNYVQCMCARRRGGVEEGMPCNGRQEVKEFEGSVIQPLQFVR